MFSFPSKTPPGFPVETKKQKVIFVIGMLADKTALAHHTLLSLHIIFIIDRHGMHCFTVPSIPPEEQIRKQSFDVKYIYHSYIRHNNTRLQVYFATDTNSMCLKLGAGESF